MLQSKKQAEYAKNLRSPFWQKLRLEILQRDDFTCVLCTDSRTTLHVHHNEYDGLPWEVSTDKLRTLCEHCHSIVHELYRHEVIAIKKRISLNTKCWEIVAFTTTDIVFLYLFFTTHKTEIITVFTKDLAA